MKYCHCVRAQLECAKLILSCCIMEVCIPVLLKEKVAARALFIKISLHSVLLQSLIFELDFKFLNLDSDRPQELDLNSD